MAAVVIDAALGSSVAQATPANFTLNFATSTGTPGVGDLIVVCCTIRGSAGTLATPSGWTAVTGNPFQNTASNTNRMYLFYRVRQAADANSVSFVVSGGSANNTLLAQAYNFGGVDDTVPIEVQPVKTQSAATSTTLAGPLTGATSLNTDALAIAFWHRDDDAGTFSTASSGWVHASFTNAVVASTLGTDAAMGMASKRLAAVGASGTYQVNVASGAAANWLGVVLIVKQQTGAGLVTLDAEGWADEATITSQSATDPYVAIVVGTGTTKADSAWSKVGTKSYRNTVAAQQQRFKINTVRPDTEQYGATIFRTSQWPSASSRVASLEGYDGTDWLQVQIQSDGGWRIAADGGSPFSSATATKTPVNTPVRLEYWYDGATGTGELRIFQGADIDNDIASYTDRVVLTGMPTNGVVGRSMYGPGVANFTGADIWYDLASIRRGAWVNLVPATTVLTKTFDLAWNLRSLITKSIGSDWNVRSIVTQSKATAWNIFSRVTQSAATSWNLRSLVSKTTDTAFNVIGRVTDTVDTAWNVRSIVSKTQATAWNLSSRVVDTVDTAWNLRSLVTKSQATAFNISSRVTKTADIAWNLRSLVTKSQATAWNLVSSVSKTAATAWNVVGRVVNTIDTAWNIRQVVTKSQATAFNILNAVSKTQATSWNLRQLVSQSAATSWNLRALITQSKAVAWNITGRITISTPTAWNLREILTKAQASSWNLRQIVSQSSATLWNIRSVVSKTQATAWNIVGRVIDTIDTSWNITGRVTQTKAVAWNVIGRVTQSQATAWNLRQIVSQSAATAWNLRQIVAQSAATSWNIRSIVSKTQATAWNIRQVITKTADTAWNVLTINAVTKTFDIAWNIREVLTKSQATSWNIRNAISKVQATAWNIRYRVWATNYNRVPGFEYWNLAGGATVDGAGVLTLPTTGAVASIKIPWDGSVDPNFYISAESMAANFETEPTFVPFTGVHYGSGYLDANDQPTPNAQPNTGNGFAGKTTVSSLGVWAPRVQWGAPGLMASGGKYLLINMFCSTAYTGTGVKYRNPMLTTVSHGSGTPYVPLGFNIAYNIREVVTKSQAVAWNLRSIVTQSVASAWNIVGRLTQSLTTAWNLRQLVKGKNLITVNQATVETDATGFTQRGVGSSIARSTAQAASGVASLALTTAANAGQGVNVGNPPTTLPACTPGATYTASVMVRAGSVARTIQISLDFWTAAGAYISGTAGGSVLASTSGWQQITVTTTAPAGAGKIHLNASVVGTPGAGEVYYFDEFGIWEGSSTNWEIPTGSPSFSTAWNINSIVSKTVDTAWNIRSLVSKAMSTAWNLRQVVSQSAATAWNLRSIVTNSAPTAWNIRSIVSKSQATSWNLRQLVFKTQDVQWNVQSLGAVTKSFSVAWNLREILTKQSPIAWNLRELLSKQSTTAWNIRTIVTRSQGSAWAIRNAIAQVTSTSWNIRTLATKSINASWNIQGRTTKNVTVAWVVLERSQKNVPVSWNILQALAKEVTTAWNIQAPVYDTAAIEFEGNVIVVAIFGTDGSVVVEHPLNGVEAPDDLYGSVITESDVLKILGGEVKVGD